MPKSQTHLKVDWRIAVLAGLLRFSKPITQRHEQELRKAQRTRRSPVIDWVWSGRKQKLPKIVDQVITGRHGDIPIRLYYPDSQAPLPLVLFFHGGGWVTGNISTHDSLCRHIAYRSQALVLSVDYHLAPSFPYPVALEDCFDAAQWANDNAQTLGAHAQPLILMGDSAGGNLAAAVSLLSRDRHGPNILKQILIYPVVDGTLNHPSMDRYAAAPVLSKAAMQFFVDQYASSPTDIQSPYFSPLLADLSHLPPALIILAAYDPLRDEGQAYARRLQRAGIPVQVKEYSGMVHGFLSFPRFCHCAEDALGEIAEFIQAPNPSPTDNRSPLAKSPPD